MLSFLLNREGLIFFTYDKDGVVTSSEGKGLADLGLKPGETVGESVFHRKNHDDQQNIENLQQALDGETFVGIAAYGGQFLETQYGPLNDANGNIVGAYGICLNVTLRERLVRQQQFLFNVGKILAETNGHLAAFEEIARIAIPVLGDYCVIDVADVDGKLNQTAVAHINPRKEDLAFELQKSYSFNVDYDYPTYRVFKSGVSAFHPHVTDEMIEKSARDATELKLYRGLAPISVIMVPITAHGHTYGVITLARSESGQHYEPQDLIAAEQLGRIAGLAMGSADFRTA